MAGQKLTRVQCFALLVDPRIEHNKRHLLSEILSLAVSAAFAGAEEWEDIEEFGHRKHTWLKQYLSLPYGIPSLNTISRVDSVCQDMHI